MGKNSQGKIGLKREFSAGGVVFKKESGKVLWLIIKPAGTDRWQLPKGTIDQDKKEKSQSTALREVEEEGGVKAKVIEKIGNERFFFFWQGERILKTVTFYLMEYEEDSKKGHDHEVDETAFLPFEEAYAKLTFKNDKEMLKKAKEILSKGVQENLV